MVRGNPKDLTVPALGPREFGYLARRLYYESPRALDEAIKVRMAFARELWEG